MHSDRSVLRICEEHLRRCLNLSKQTLWKLLWPTPQKLEKELNILKRPFSFLPAGKGPAPYHGMQRDDGCGNTFCHQRPSIPSKTRRQRCDITNPLKKRKRIYAAAPFSLSSLASSCGSLRETMSPPFSSPPVHNDAPRQPLLTLMTFIWGREVQ